MESNGITTLQLPKMQFYKGKTMEFKRRQEDQLDAPFSRANHKCPWQSSLIPFIGWHISQSVTETN